MEQQHLTPEEQQAVRQQAMNQLKAVYEDGYAEINGRRYEFAKMRHEKRKAVFAYFTSIQSQMQVNNFAFMDTPQFNHVFKIISEHVTFEGSVLTKLPDHWDDYPQDFMLFATSSMGVISYPFLPESAGGSVSQSQQTQAATTSKKVT